MSDKISVIVCSYNCEKYIEKCINSLIRQTYNNIEIICVDDCSEDNTLEIIKKLALDDARIKIVKNSSNLGLSGARNAGISEATGEYITFVDGDDEVDVKTYEKVARKFATNRDVIWFGIGTVYEANIEMKKSDDNYYDIRFEGDYTVNRSELLNFDCSCCNKVFKKELITSEFLFTPGVYYEDALFYMKFFSKPRNVFFIKEKLYIYYRHKNSIMASTFRKSEGKAVHHLLIMEELYRFWNARGYIDSSEAFQKIFITYFWLAYNNSPAFERAKIVGMATDLLRKWDIESKSNHLINYIKQGRYTIVFGDHGKIATNGAICTLPKLRGIRRIMCFRNEYGHNVLRVFGCKMYSKKIM